MSLSFLIKLLLARYSALPPIPLKFLNKDQNTNIDKSPGKSHVEYDIG